MLSLNLDNLGLYTYNNIIAKVPPGSMTVANNVVIDKPGVVETRRGFKQYGATLTTPIYKIIPFQDKLIAHHSSKLSYDSDGAGTWSDYSGTYAAPTGNKIKWSEVNQNLYFTTDNGIYKIDTITNNPYQAGGTPALDVTVALNAGATGYLANNYNCAYRITWIYTDANGNLIEGNPSMSVTINNTAGTTKNVDVTFTVPSNVTTSYSYRIYRTQQTANTIPPGDTFQLCYQAVVTAGNIAAKYVTVTDVTNDLLLGTTLYTSPGAQGQLQTNDAPPLAQDICTFQGMTFYLNCKTIQQFYITLIGTGAPSGFQVADTIDLVGTSTHTYTGNAANDFPNRLFAVYTAGTVSVNIDTTARNLVSAINQDPNNSEFYAYYVSGYAQLPGQILIKARNLSHASFTAKSSRGGAFSPVLPASGTTYVSSNNTVLNGAYVSKLNQPEAVPVSNLLFIGAGDQAIYRGFALRDAVIIESAGGVFRITGTSPSNLTVTPFDNTVTMYGPDTGVALNNSVYSFSTQGIISVTESGTQIMSRNVEGDILKLSAPALYTNFLDIAFGIAYESDRKYILALASQTDDDVSTLQYVYNWITQSFTTWDIPITAGIVNPYDNLLYLAGDDGQVLQERKSFTVTDYADREWAVTVVSSTGKVVTLNSIVSAVIGYSLAQKVTAGGVELTSMITAIDTVNKTVTVEDEFNWYPATAGAIYQPINSTITYAPITCGYPNYLKRFQPSIQFIFSQASFKTIESGFTTDLYFSEESTTIQPKTTGNWGTFPWGSLPFGVSGSAVQMIPVFLTKNTLMAHWLGISMTLNEAFQNMALNGAALFYDIVGERSR